jgi:hypothetical protein
VFIDGIINFINNDIKLAQSTLETVATEFIKPIVERRNFTVHINTINDAGLNVLTQGDDEAIKYYVRIYNDIISVTGQLSTLKEEMEQERVRVNKSFYNSDTLTQTERDNWGNKLTEDGLYRNKIYGLYKELYDYDKEYNEEYMKVLSVMRSRNIEQAQNLSNFQLPTHSTTIQTVLPSFNIPRTHTCTIGPIGGGGVDLVASCN